MGTRTTKAVFLGYAETSDAWRFLDLETNSIIEARDAEYFKEKFIKDKSTMLHDLPQKLSMRENEIPESDKESKSMTEEVIPQVKEPPIKRARRRRPLDLILPLIM